MDIGGWQIYIPTDLTTVVVLLVVGLLLIRQSNRWIQQRHSQAEARRLHDEERFQIAAELLGDTKMAEEVINQKRTRKKSRYAKDDSNVQEIVDYVDAMAALSPDTRNKLSVALGPLFQEMSGAGYLTEAKAMVKKLQFIREADLDEENTRIQGLLYLQKLQDVVDTFEAAKKLVVTFNPQLAMQIDVVKQYAVAQGTQVYVAKVMGEQLESVVVPMGSISQQVYAQLMPTQSDLDRLISVPTPEPPKPASDTTGATFSNNGHTEPGKGQASSNGKSGPGADDDFFGKLKKSFENHGE